MRQGIRVTAALLALALMVAGGAWAQGAVASRITGQVVGSDGGGLPGVTVTFESPNLQGSRVVVTESGGNYASPPLPPGIYTVTFELAGFQPVGEQVRATAATTVPLNATLEQVDIREEIVVTGAAIETISQTGVGSTTITGETMAELPTARTVLAAVSLSPGVAEGLDSAAGMSISGGMSWDNLYTMNGVVMNENIRGNPFNLFIEDAIQEQTIITSGVSAEYGRFGGGVVTAVTKSGGNEFSGSFRTSLANDDWKGSNRFSPDREDNLLETYEATLGGRIVQDRLWFFGAGRSFDDGGVTLTSNDFAIPYVRGREEDRYEIKLTGSITPSHQLQATYLEIDEIQTNVPHGGLVQYLITVDDGSLDSQRDLPQDLQVLSYTGILTPNLFVEGYYGERNFAFEGTGGSFNGNFGESSPIFDLQSGRMYNESWFCGTCRDEDRDNEQGRLKGTYFLSTDSVGAHDLVFGYETFTDIRASDNHQSATDWQFYHFGGSERIGNLLTPVIPTASEPLQSAMWLHYRPVLNPTQGTDFQTDSLFVNDSWRFNDAWTFNLGVRYDQTDATNSAGVKAAKDDGISPRMGLTWNPGGKSPWNLYLSAGRYVGLAANSIFDGSSAAGTPALFRFGYTGPSINTAGDLIDAPTALNSVIDWLLGVCPAIGDIWDPNDPISSPANLDPLLSCSQLIAVSIPGATTLLDSNLRPTHADEVKIGLSRPIGNVGWVRADLVRREWGNFFVNRRDLSTIGLVDGVDATLRVNSDIVNREYTGLDIANTFALLDRRLRLGSSLTLSRLEGNAAGETPGSGPVASTLLTYPEYLDLRWNAPDGKLRSDQPVRLRAWGTYDLVQVRNHRLSASLVQSYQSGAPYGASGNVRVAQFVDNPGYLTPPANNTYFFTGRDAFRTDSITQTDLAINYGLHFGRWEIFVQPQLLNVFSEDSVRLGRVNTTVLTNVNDPSLAAFNPFTETPIEGVHWRKGPNFGKPLSEGDLQDVREFQISLGFRFNP